MYLRRSAAVKYFVAAFLGAAVFCEWIIYLVQPMYWADLECEQDDQSCTRILFIADPQIQGDLAVSPPWSYIVNWDSDRYLKSTFNVAMKQFKPHALVFLGDLMDEGSISTTEQFHGYVKRLSKIFVASDETIQRVWVPGDNDIGGENEMVHPEKVAEFERAFPQSSVIQFRDISFYKVNAITQTYPQDVSPSAQYGHNFKMVISHYPVTSRHMFGLKVVDTIHPHIFFCAHDHESKYVTQTKDLQHRQTTWFYTPKLVLSLDFDEDKQYEVYVPTCSYRMGTSDIGFGAAVLEHNGKRLRYTVFWSPKRFPYLVLYLVILLILWLYCFVFCAARLLHRQTNKTMTADMSPLLERM